MQRVLLHADDPWMAEAVLRDLGIAARLCRVREFESMLCDTTYGTLRRAGALFGVQRGTLPPRPPHAWMRTPQGRILYGPQVHSSRTAPQSNEISAEQAMELAILGATEPLHALLKVRTTAVYARIQGKTALMDVELRVVHAAKIDPGTEEVPVRGVIEVALVRGAAKAMDSLVCTLTNAGMMRDSTPDGMVALQTVLSDPPGAGTV